MMRATKVIFLFAAVFLFGTFFSEAKDPAPEVKDQPKTKEIVKAAAKEEAKATQSVQNKKAVLNWLENYEQACRIAREQHKPILLYFTGSDWCSWCFYLHKNLLDHQSFIDYANKSLVLMKADFPKSVPQDKNVKEQNQKLAHQFKVSGFPSVYILDSNGKIIGESQYSIDRASKKPVFVTRTSDGKIYSAKPDAKMDAGAAYAQNIQDIWNNIQKQQKKAVK